MNKNRTWIHSSQPVPSDSSCQTFWGRLHQVYQHFQTTASLRIAGSKLKVRLFLSECVLASDSSVSKSEAAQDALARIRGQTSALVRVFKPPVENFHSHSVEVMSKHTVPLMSAC